jgi:hypothetical protein
MRKTSQSQITNKYVYVCMHVCAYRYIFFADVIHNCLVLIQSMYIERNICKNKYATFFQRRQEHREELTLGFAYLMPDCWLEVSFHPEGPTTDQLDQGFPWFSSALEQMLSWHPNFHFALLASHAALQMLTPKFRPNVALLMLTPKFTTIQPFQRHIKK